MFRLPYFLLALAALVLTGCSATTGSARSEGDLRFEPGESVAVTLKSHTGPDGDVTPTHAMQGWLEGCIKDGIDRVNDRLTLAASSDRNVRYRIEVAVRTTESDAQWDAMNEQVRFVLGRSWLQVTTFSGTVFDDRYGRIGLVEASAAGQEGAGVAFWFYLPFPIGAVARTEVKACRNFGEELARLMARSVPK